MIISHTPGGSHSSTAAPLIRSLLGKILSILSFLASTVIRLSPNSVTFFASPADLTEAVTVYIPYPEVLEGTPEEEGIRTETLSLIADLIETDIEYGFTSA